MHIFIVGLISVLSAIISIIILFFFFPQYLCYTVHATSESIIYDAEEVSIEPESIYIETFSPIYSYVKTISIHIGCNTDLSGQKIVGQFMDEQGRIIEECTYQISQDDIYNYAEFKIEEWVKVGHEYKFAIIFPPCEGIKILYGPQSIGPDEHVSLSLDSQLTEDNIYMRYIYGNYSKKLLLLWFLAFFSVEYLIFENIYELVESHKFIIGNNRKD